MLFCMGMKSCLALSEEHRLIGCRIFCPKKEGVTEWRKLHDEECFNFYS